MSLTRPSINTSTPSARPSFSSETHRHSSYQHGPDGTLSPRQSARDTPSPRQSARDTPSPRQSARDTPSPRQPARDTPSPRQPVHGPQHSPTRIPYRTGRVGAKGGNWEAFEHTHYHLMGASAHQVQRTADSQSVPEPAGEEPLVVEVSEDPSGDKVRAVLH
ncbi:hypothetical protein C0Q70_06177 [Pomacea canaliculata]|uniref:Uncharacterized protein n=1 Tax=Pomacea canaliculata TaxID=400727 RepID=A0A2T7PN85_POMCA|nr:hypothetical protein C0Q70_06177 [Pomacea canaliculata]